MFLIKQIVIIISTIIISGCGGGGGSAGTRMGSAASTDPISAADNPFEEAQKFLKEMTEKKSGIAEDIPIFKAFNEIY